MKNSKTSNRRFNVSDLKVAPIDFFKYRKGATESSTTQYGFLKLTPEHNISGPVIIKDEENVDHWKMVPVLDEEGNPVTYTNDGGEEITRLEPVIERKEKLFFHLWQFRRPEIVNNQIVLEADSQISEQEIKQYLHSGTEVAFTTVVHQDRGVFALAWTIVDLINEKKVELLNRPNYRVTAIIKKYEDRSNQETHSWERVVVNTSAKQIYVGGNMLEMKSAMQQEMLSSALQCANVEFEFEKIINMEWITCCNPFETPKEHAYPHHETPKKKKDKKQQEVKK